MTTLTETTETPQATASEPLTSEERKRFDTLCEDFEEARRALDNLKDEMDYRKVELMEFVQLRGYVPIGAEKSLRCEGMAYVATRTTGNTHDLDTQQITNLQLTLSRAKCSQLFPQLFSSRTEYTMQKDAGDLIKAAALPARRRAHILGVYAQCFNVKAKTPSITVETLQQSAAKAAKAAQKAAQKAAKKGGK